MSDIKLFNTNGIVRELNSTEVLLEKELQTLIENNMEVFFGIRFLKSEYKITNGRMDSIGIDENNCPVIFEYKRSVNENVVNQGLFYLDWLLDHKADFKLLVIEKLGRQEAESIDWSMPCVICIANGFTKYDIHAVNQMQKNIKLVKYRRYGKDLILFEHLNVPAVNPLPQDTKIEERRESKQKTHVEKIETVPDNIKLLYESVCEYVESLGDDITVNQLKFYTAYKKVQNFACVEVYNKYVMIFLKLDPDSVTLEEGFSRDMRNIGHYGTGDLQLTIRTTEDFKKAKKLIEEAYNKA